VLSERSKKEELLGASRLMLKKELLDVNEEELLDVLAISGPSTS
jgi:hypothetical protein